VLLEALSHHSSTAQRGFRTQAEERALMVHYILEHHIPVAPPLRAAVTIYYSQHIPRPLTARDGYDTVPLFSFSVRECSTLFRFHSEQELRYVADLLGIPSSLKHNNYRADGICGFSCMLARFAVPQRLFDLRRSLHLNWSEAKLSSIITATITFLFDKWADQIHFDHRFFDNLVLCERFAEAIRRARPHAKLKNIVGALDGSYVPIDRPGEMQRQFYSGYRGGHCLLFQGIHMPNGLITSMWGPVPGRCHTWECLLYRLMRFFFRRQSSRPGRHLQVQGP
jgi:hypothetical protein